MSFLKFRDQTDGNGRGQIHWGRANHDGAPYRGHGVPLLRDQEFEELAEQVYDTYHGTFDTSKPDQVQPTGSPHGRTLQFIIEAKENGWFRILSWNEKWVEKEDGPVMYVFVVWSEPYRELPTSVVQGRTGQIHNLAPVVQGRSHVGRPDSNQGSTPPLL